MRGELIRISQEVARQYELPLEEAMSIVQYVTDQATDYMRNSLIVSGW